jgi:hypothetical protein
MSTSTTSANALQDLIYKATTWGDIAENDTTSPATNIQIALHTGAGPTTSSQSSNEVTVGEWNTYARLNIARGAGWDAAAAGMTQNAAIAQFVEMASGTGCTITYVSTGVGGTIIHYGSLAAPRTVSAGIQPQFAANALKSTQT